MEICNHNIEDVHAKLIEILTEFDRVCRKYNIKYTLEGGTLLGAVKYKGFVPWDDDIDIVMLREDYDKFCEAAKNDLSEKYFLSNNDTCTQFPLNYSKLCAEGTLYVQRAYEHLNMHQGVFIDIFPIDNVNMKWLNAQKALTGIFQGAKSLKLKTGTSKKLRHIIASCLPIKTLNRIMLKIITFFNKKETEYVYEICNPNKKFVPLERRIYEEVEDREFCGRMFLCSKYSDEFLASRFGDITLTPPLEKQKPSHGIIKCKL